MEDPSIHASLSFLAKDPLYQTTRPYIIDYVSKSLPVTNHVMTVEENLPLYDLRGVEDKLTFSRAGIAVLDMQSTMNYDDFSKHDKIVDCYFQEVGHALLKYLNASSVQMFDYAVCAHVNRVPYQRLCLR